MKTPVIMTETIVQTIADMGKRRYPNEACGVILPTPHQDRLVWELPNHALRREDHFILKGEDILIQFEDWDAQDWDNLTVWHTHPNGQLGPSKQDLDNRAENVGNLVVTLLEDGSAKATWY